MPKMILSPEELILKKQIEAGLEIILSLKNVLLNPYWNSWKCSYYIDLPNEVDPFTLSRKLETNCISHYVHTTGGILKNHNSIRFRYDLTDLHQAVVYAEKNPWNGIFPPAFSM